MIDKMKRIKDFNIQYISGIWGDYASADDKDGVFVLRSTEQKVNGDLKIISPAYIKTNYKSKNILKDGDLLITKSSGSRSHVGKCSYINKEVASFNYAFSNFMMGVRIKDKNLDSQYLCYCINSNFIKKQIEDSCTNVTLNNLNQKNVSNWLIPDFNMAKQNSIVFFLNKNIKVLNNIIEKYTKKIELLKEYKESLIYEAVTKGLDANVEMKDSGVNWIREIPIDWDVKRIKDIAKISTGGTPPRNNDNSFSLDYENNFMWIKPENLDGYKRIIETKEYITPFGLKFIKKFNGKKSIIFSGIGDIGKMGITDNSFTTNQQNHVIQSTKCNIKFLFYSLYAQREKIKIIAKGNVVKIFNASELKRVKVALPNKNDQDLIVTFLDKKTNETDTAIDALFKKVALLNELKEAIIYEAVTGKIDVDTDGDKYLAAIDAL